MGIQLLWECQDKQLIMEEDKNDKLYSVTYACIVPAVEFES